MKMILSQKIWFVAFIIMTTASIIGTMQHPSWVESSLSNYKYSFRLMTGFYWTHKSVNDNEVTIVERSYLLFPDIKLISVEKTVYNGKEEIKVDDSIINSCIGFIAYFISLCISVNYLIKRSKNKHNI